MSSPWIPGTASRARTGRAAGADASAGLFSRINPGRISGIIVDQIRLLMRQGQLQPGDRLPAERELCEHLGVSRVTVREALRVLELGIIPLVCERATEEDIEDPLGLCHRAREALASGIYDMSMSVDFHTRVAQCAHNGAVELLPPSLQGPLLMSLEEAQQVAPDRGRKGRRSTWPLWRPCET